MHSLQVNVTSNQTDTRVFFFLLEQINFAQMRRKARSSSSLPPQQLEPEGSWPSSGQHGLFSEPV